mmetsp:Transcript_107562/g.175986  ORF Transcript_107562/g.175986 Transcript_107562/m.175986 type:complete len:95 (+) Transcript_107562:1289-1573(+)
MPFLTTRTANTGEGSAECFARRACWTIVTMLATSAADATPLHITLFADFILQQGTCWAVMPWLTTNSATHELTSALCMRKSSKSTQESVEPQHT